MKTTIAIDESSLLKSTTSRCPVCHKACPAEVWRSGHAPAKVYLKRICAEHGDFTACIASDARLYWLSKGASAESGCCGGSCCSADGSNQGTLGRNAAGRGDETFEVLSTCLALIEIVDSCNLNCPTCFADSPVGHGAEARAVPLENVIRRIEGVIQRKGRIEVLQLSGGEPTLHPRFFELLAWAQQHPKIDYIIVNTNGVRIAIHDDFLSQLAAAAARKKLQLYLQFDGTQEAGQHALRGADLRDLREKALDRCADIGLPVTLAMTVTPENLPHLWEAICFGLERPHVHGITFQPLFTSGRIPADLVAPSAAERVAPVTRLNTADLILAAIDQSEGCLRLEDFTPLPCGDPNCAVIGYLIRHAGGFRSISEFIDFSRLQGFLQDKVRYNLEDLARCGCESEPLGDLLKKLEVDAGKTFRIMVKPFMDAWTWDQDRIDRCCTHVIRPDGKLDSFCRYYSGFADARHAP